MNYSVLFLHLDDDAEAEPDLENNPFALDVAEHEDLYIEDPKKALKNYYEREGNLVSSTSSCS